MGLNMSFNDFVNELNLANFSASEILTKTGNTGNSTPPEAIWDNIGPTILMVQLVRTKFGVPITLNSVYRSETYNRRIGGAKLSQHQAFCAIDFRPSRRDLLDDMADWLISQRGKWIDAPREYNRADVQIGGKSIPSKPIDWRKNGGQTQFKFAGGVSLYTSFVHVDTRGINANW